MNLELNILNSVSLEGDCIHELVDEINANTSLMDEMDSLISQIEALENILAIKSCNASTESIIDVVGIENYQTIQQYSIEECQQSLEGLFSKVKEIGKKVGSALADAGAETGVGEIARVAIGGSAMWKGVFDQVKFKSMFKKWHSQIDSQIRAIKSDCNNPRSIQISISILGHKEGSNHFNDNIGKEVSTEVKKIYNVLRNLRSDKKSKYDRTYENTDPALKKDPTRKLDLKEIHEAITKIRELGKLTTIKTNIASIDSYIFKYLQGLYEITSSYIGKMMIDKANDYEDLNFSSKYARIQQVFMWLINRVRMSVLSILTATKKAYDQNLKPE